MQSLTAAALLVACRPLASFPHLQDKTLTLSVQSFKYMVDGPVPNAREFAALFDVSATQLKLAELALLRAVDWCVRSPTACDYLHVLGDRERGADCIPPHVIQQLREVQRMNSA